MLWNFIEASSGVEFCILFCTIYILFSYKLNIFNCLSGPSDFCWCITNHPRFSGIKRNNHFLFLSHNSGACLGPAGRDLLGMLCSSKRSLPRAALVQRLLPHLSGAWAGKTQLLRVLMRLFISTCLSTRQLQVARPLTWQLKSPQVLVLLARHLRAEFLCMT